MMMKKTIFLKLKMIIIIRNRCAFIKNPSKGPLSAIKEGVKQGNSNSIIVYPADDF